MSKSLKIRCKTRKSTVTAYIMICETAKLNGVDSQSWLTLSGFAVPAAGLRRPVSRQISQSD